MSHTTDERNVECSDGSFGLYGRLDAHTDDYDAHKAIQSQDVSTHVQREARIERGSITSLVSLSVSLSLWFVWRGYWVGAKK